MGLGFLHTAEVHRQTFRTLTRAADPTIEVVDESLLEQARQNGLADSAMLEGIRLRLHEPAGAGATVIVCTCGCLDA